MANNPQENTNLESSTNTEKELVKDVLSKNRGFAVGDLHSSTDAVKFIERNVKSMKESGLDTIYMEGDPSIIKRMDAQTPEELRETRKTLNDAYHNKNHEMHKDMVEMIKAEASIYGGSVTADEMHKHNVGRFDIAIAAKENGIRLGTLDGNKDGYISKAIDATQSGQRYETPNSGWVNNVESDRKKIDPEGTGKFLVWGGAAHFIDTDMGQGRVDEKLGIPSMAVTKSAMPKGLGFMERDFQQTQNGQDPDFWISGGRQAKDLKGEIEHFRQGPDFQDNPELKKIADNLKKNGAQVTDCGNALPQNASEGPAQNPVRKR